MGAAGELLLLKVVMRLPSYEEAAIYMARHLYNPHGGGQVGPESPDLVFFDPDQSRIGIDAKTYDCAPNKRYFAINAAKHQGLNGQASYYFTVCMAPHGKGAYLSRLIPYTDVHEWEHKKLRVGGSASYNLSIGEYKRRYFTTPPNLIQIGRENFDPAEVQRLSQDKGVQEELRALIPSLERHQWI